MTKVFRFIMYYKSSNLCVNNSTAQNGGANPYDFYFSERNRMNKSQLIEALAKAENLALKKAEEVVNTVFGDMEKALIHGERVEIRGFGSFKIKHYDGYQGRNPKTGEIINVSEKKLPFFKVGKGLKERVDIS